MNEIIYMITGLKIYLPRYRCSMRREMRNSSSTDGSSVFSFLSFYQRLTLPPLSVPLLRSPERSHPQMEH